ncbi:MAG: arsenate reductase (azurin) small subunit [Gammaproteobacteria bacterium]|nr:MAG: arsenate reductase (azurin) small subunit [Gammaproteobacteria bacterium]RKZ43582.1 MAG: arsenate reductase (azurin) small subunit [Gammaproteobacteria bacterium]RKZ76493.1 MAG: arsenate reductase (azurin) small subunit [Gammaproteobacteria bacterium]
MTNKTHDESALEHGQCMLNRREFLLYSGATAAAVSTITLFPGTAQAQSARVVGYSRKLIAKLSELKDHELVNFNYPDDGKNAGCMLVKMGNVKAGGGIGPQSDVIAFSYLCTHQGGPLHGSYKVTDDQRTLGQCPFHLSVYDLRRHGIIVSGQAYQSLPQVLLELEGDDIYAVGMMGLLYGRNENLMTA